MSKEPPKLVYAVAEFRDAVFLWFEHGQRYASQQRATNRDCPSEGAPWREGANGPQCIEAEEEEVADECWDSTNCKARFHVNAGC